MKFTSSIDILYVEDDDVDIESMHRAFKASGVTNTLHIAHDGIEALELLRGGVLDCPRIVLLDINMPRMNGLEFLAEIRRDKQLKQLTVFVLTTSDQEGDVSQAHRSGVASYLVKPDSVAGLVEMVTRLKRLWRSCEFVPRGAIA